jgi:hypothetical protein
MKPGDKEFNIGDTVSWYDHETKYVYAGHIVMKITFEDNSLHYNKWRRYKVTMGNYVVELPEEELFPTREACIEHYIDLFKSI